MIQPGTVSMIQPGTVSMIQPGTVSMFFDGARGRSMASRIDSGRTRQRDVCMAVAPRPSNMTAAKPIARPVFACAHAHTHTRPCRSQHGGMLLAYFDCRSFCSSLTGPAAACMHLRPCRPLPAVSGCPFGCAPHVGRGPRLMGAPVMGHLVSVRLVWLGATEESHRAIRLLSRRRVRGRRFG